MEGPQQQAPLPAHNEANDEAGLGHSNQDLVFACVERDRLDEEYQRLREQYKAADKRVKDKGLAVDVNERRTLKAHIHDVHAKRHAKQASGRCGRLRTSALCRVLKAATPQPFPVHPPLHAHALAHAAPPYVVVADISNGTYGVVHVAIREDDYNKAREAMRGGHVMDDRVVEGVKRACGSQCEAVALKCFRVHGSSTKARGLDKTVLREIAVLKELDHPNVVPLLGVHLKQPPPHDPAAQGASPAIALPLHNNAHLSLEFPFADLDLLTLIRGMAARQAKAQQAAGKRRRTEPLAHTRLPGFVTRAILFQLLTGVEYLHTNFVIHRDIKPGNVLVYKTGPRAGTVQLADFGLARHFKGCCADLCRDGQVCTLWYRAPELLLGSDSYSIAVDMWAVGCVFGELLIGKPLFATKDPAANAASPGERGAKRQRTACWQEIQAHHAHAAQHAAQGGQPCKHSNSSSSSQSQGGGAGGGLVVGKVHSKPQQVARSHESVKRQMDKVFGIVGRPDARTWRGVDALPRWADVSQASPLVSCLASEMSKHVRLSADELDLLARMLCVDPATRINASQALAHPYFAVPDSTTRRDAFRNVFEDFETKARFSPPSRQLHQPSHTRPVMSTTPQAQLADGGSPGDD